MDRLGNRSGLGAPPASAMEHCSFTDTPFAHLHAQDICLRGDAARICRGLTYSDARDISSGERIRGDLSPFPAASLAQMQKRLLGEQVVCCVKSSSFYRERLAPYGHEIQELLRVCGEKVAAGIQEAADDLHLLARIRNTLSRLPLTSPSMLTDYRRFLCTSQDAVERVVTLTTSGSTGSPKRLAFARDALENTARFFADGMWQILESGDTLLVCLPGAEREGGVADLLGRGLCPRGIKVRTVPSNVTDSELLARVEALRPQSLVLSPRQLSLLAERYPDKAPVGLSSFLVSSDWCDPEFLAAVAECWHVRYLNHYGITESCFGCALECPAHDGYHIRHLDVFCEIIDPVTEEVLPPGEVGELVFTTLRQKVMPLLRYRTGDATSFLPGPCACGSPYSRLGPMLGRYVPGTRDICHPRKAERCHVPAGSGTFASVQTYKNSGTLAERQEGMQQKGVERNG